MVLKSTIKKFILNPLSISMVYLDPQSFMHRRFSPKGSSERKNHFKFFDSFSILFPLFFNYFSTKMALTACARKTIFQKSLKDLSVFVCC